ncbi:tripartite tricarboxylate transporter substrate-binding protein, partial [Staphylococcus arlettae]|uniref:tripartite tricarboxylate transporter substrate-binding protein n=1 Tax=Staphylococcus arlettae TaxID=29378 RepID=UPI003CF4CE18
AAADGYTVGLGGPTTHVVNGAALTLPYDVLASFEPVSLLPTMPLVVLANKENPATNLKELIKWLKAKPDGVLQEDARKMARRADPVSPLQ